MDAMRDEIRRLRAALEPFAIALKVARGRFGKYPDRRDVEAVAFRFISHGHLKNALSEMAQEEDTP